ncbi:MAG: FG-GAP repeat domain-containing protein, partial [bacterium]
GREEEKGRRHGGDEDARPFSQPGPQSTLRMRLPLVALAAAALGALVPVTLADPTEAIVERACSTCHVVPSPDILPRDSWRTVLYEMAGIIMANVGAPKGAPPASLDFDVEQLAHYYEERAPRELKAPEPWPAPDAPPRFVRHPMRLAAGVPPPPRSTMPFVANVRFLDIGGSGRLQVVAADMSSGLVLAGDPANPEAGLRVLAHAGNPCHVELVDLDRDGLMDLVVADLGDVPPEDHEKGRVLWLRRQKDGTYATIVLARGLPRVADVEAVDVDGDGDIDLVVAAFGWRTVGGIFLLENVTKTWDAPSFVRGEIDARPGAIHVPVADLDGDGRPDFVALLAQHYESVEFFKNLGKGEFRPQILDQAPHPAWGSSGLELVDFDKDGDLDILVTNGDMLDDFLLKPYHGIRWLENKGGLRFEAHSLANLPGVHRALVADIDGDGDNDVVAGAYVRFKVGNGPPRSRPDLASLVWLEQQERGQWKRHTLEQGAAHVTLDVADYDRDGDIDIVVGNFSTEGAPYVDVWENVSKKR